jgi:uncharacterized membrane protein YeaQ/YmgE (transglycosylase-associated protein family)
MNIIIWMLVGSVVGWCARQWPAARNQLALPAQAA